jgi:hypothetical protein
VRAVEQKLGELAERMLAELTSPADDVVYGLRYCVMSFNGEHDGEPVIIESPAINLYLSVRTEGSTRALVGSADLPMSMASTDEGFGHGLRMLWEQIEFHRIAMQAADVEVVGNAIINARPADS